MIVRLLAPGDYAEWSTMRQRLWPEEGRDDVADFTRMHVPFTVLVAEGDHAVKGWAQAQGVSGIGSDVLLANVESLAWHPRMGFVEESQVVKLVLELD